MRFLVFFLLLIPLQLLAASKYVREAASGAGTGADWTDAYTVLPASLTRGDTYYIADGAYAAYTFDDAISGTTLITIKKATVADHGTSTGWSDTYGDGQAIWGHALQFYTDYYLFDGASGSGAATNTYGFHVLATTPTLDQKFVWMGGGAGIDPSFITIAHTMFIAPINDVEKIGIGSQSQSYQTNTTVHSCYFVRMQNAFDLKGAVNCNFISNYVADGFSSALHHGEQINFGLRGTQPASNIVVSYNIFTNCTGTGVIIGNNAAANEFAATDIFIYGNVFDSCTSGGNGIIATTTDGYWKNIYVIGNTFAGGSTLWFSDCQAASSATVKANSTGYYLTNNLIYNRSAAIGDNADDILNHDYTSFFDCTSIPAISNGQTASGSPFLSTTDGLWALASDTSARLALGGSFGTDALGTTFSSSRGWKQYSGGASPNTYRGFSFGGGVKLIGPGSVRQ
jgi:hypothetical protein